MNRRAFLRSVPALAALATQASSLAQDAGAGAGAARSAEPVSGSDTGLEVITLPKPERDGGKSVLAALWERKTTRSISDKELAPQMLSNLLWAAWGVNRQNDPRGRIGRTAASASNSQEIDLYVALSKGIYLYEAIGHRLVPVVAGDQRVKVSRRGRRGSAAASAPVNLIYVVDIARYSRGTPQEPGLRDPEIQKSYYNVATGLIAGNVYLFAASQGLAAWFHNCDKDGLAATLKLRPEQRVLYAQTVGYSS